MAVSAGRGRGGELGRGHDEVRERIWQCRQTRAIRGGTLQGKVVVRRNHADYPAAGKREAFAHDDLMVFQSEGEQLRAHYFDSEGHHVEYSVAMDGAARRLVLVSAATPGQPRFRLSYDL